MEVSKGQEAGHVPSPCANAGRSQAHSFEMSESPRTLLIEVGIRDGVQMFELP